jgi:YgiT-type zinc finger domain-containing protein
MGIGLQEEKILMQCVICKMGETKPGTTSVTLQRGGTTVVIKDVPAEICENCGEYYLSEEISERVLALAETAVMNNAEIEILRFAA